MVIPDNELILHNHNILNSNRSQMQSIRSGFSVGAEAPLFHRELT